MEQKKRHNPEITQEDLAKQAFDRNNDALPLKESLDAIVNIDETEQVQVIKSDTALQKGLYDLAIKTFGEDIDVGKSVAFFENSFSWRTVKLTQKQNKKWYQRREFKDYATIEVDCEASEKKIEDVFQEKHKQNKDGFEGIMILIEDTLQEVGQTRFVEKGKYAPIKITAHTPKALARAKTFAVEYKKLTGQKAIVIQNCTDEEKLEQKVEEKTTKPHLGVRELVKKLNTKLTQSIFISAFSASMLGTSAYQIAQKNYDHAGILMGVAIIGAFVAGYMKSNALIKHQEELESLIDQYRRK